MGSVHQLVSLEEVAGLPCVTFQVITGNKIDASVSASSRPALTLRGSWQLLTLNHCSSAAVAEWWHWSGGWVCVTESRFLCASQVTALTVIKIRDRAGGSMVRYVSIRQIEPTGQVHEWLLTLESDCVVLSILYQLELMLEWCATFA